MRRREAGTGGAAAVGGGADMAARCGAWARLCPLLALAALAGLGAAAKVSGAEGTDRGGASRLSSRFRGPSV